MYILCCFLNNFPKYYYIWYFEYILYNIITKFIINTYYTCTSVLKYLKNLSKFIVYLKQLEILNILYKFFILCSVQHNKMHIF